MWANSICKTLIRRFSTQAPSKYALPELKFSYSALEPVISSKLLETHHKKHHQTYVNNLNAALEQFQCNIFLMQKLRRTLIIIKLLAFAKPSSSILEDILTIPFIGKIQHPSEMEEGNTPQLNPFSPSKSSNNSDPTKHSSTSSRKGQSQSKVQDGDGQHSTTFPNL